MRYYIDQDLDKAVEYGMELELEHDNLALKLDVAFNLGTAYSLRMEGTEDLDEAIKRFQWMHDVETPQAYK